MEAPPQLQNAVATRVSPAAITDNQCILLKGKIGTCTVWILVDSGASMDFISEALLPHLP